MIDASDGEHDISLSVVKDNFSATPLKIRETAKICRNGKLECLALYKIHNRNCYKRDESVSDIDDANSSSFYTKSDDADSSGTSHMCKKIVRVIRKCNFSKIVDTSREELAIQSTPIESNRGSAVVPSFPQILKPFSLLPRTFCMPVKTCAEEKYSSIKPITIVDKSYNADDLEVPDRVQMFPESPALELNIKDSDVDKLNCERCSYKAYHHQQLRDHMLKNHKDEIFSCLCCPHIFFHDSARQEHYKIAHPKCYCKECGFVTKHGYMLTRHKQSHSEEGRKCHECGKLLKDQYVLKMHMKMVHSSVEEAYNCDICPKVFNRKAHLKRHMKTHDKEKPHCCPYSNCSYRGFERSDLKKHLLIHNEPKYQCLTCNRFFRHAKNRDIHAKRHTGQKDYKCGVCGFFGYTFTDVRKHIERRHSGHDLPSRIELLQEQQVMTENIECQVIDQDVEYEDTTAEKVHKPKRPRNPECNKGKLSPIDHIECFDEEPFPESSPPMYEIQMSENVLDFTDDD